MASYASLKNLSHDAELAEALGNMVVVWANAETYFIATLARVSGMPLNMAQSGYYRIPTFESRIKFILSLIPEWKAANFDKAAIETAITKLSKLSAARNQWVHGDWAVSSPVKSETVIFNHRVPADSDQRRKPAKAEDVRNHFIAVGRRADDLEKLIDWELFRWIDLARPESLPVKA